MKIKVYSDIAGQAEQLFCDTLGISHKIFSAETVKDIFQNNLNEKNFHFDIHCNGGSTTEGFAIYDLMRTSGKNIYCNIDGDCHSMAIILLLAAPFENRSANPKATALIHDVRLFFAGDMTADEALFLAEDLLHERNRILDVYGERTRFNRNKLEEIMLEEKIRSANELLEWGFISTINNYTNQKKKNMSRKKYPTKTIVDRITNFLKGKGNYAFTDTEGAVLFETDTEDEVLEVGMSATPDGTFELPDGRTVIITDGQISEIIEVEEEIEDLRNQVAQLTKQLNKANALLHGARNELAKTRSTYNAASRQGIIEKGTQKTAEELKNEIRKNLGKTTKEA